MQSTLNQPTVIMLVGIPGSGKSTWIKDFLSACADKDSWTVLGTDLIIDEHAEERGISYQEANKTLNRKKVESKFKAQLRDAFKKNMNVLWDQTNVGRNARAKKLAMIPATYNVEAVVFELDRDEVNRRLAKRQTETGKFVPNFVVDQMMADYSRPSKTEGFSKVQVINS